MNWFIGVYKDNLDAVDCDMSVAEITSVFGLLLRRV